MKKMLSMFTVLAAAGLAVADILPIPGTNTVGFAPLAAPESANTIITVPFDACLGNGAAGMLSDLVATNGLVSHASDPAAADQLVVLTTNGASQVYYYYYFKTGQGWTAITSTQLMPDGSSQGVTPPSATSFALARGLGFWVKRPTGAGSTLYVKGQVSETKQSTEVKTGLNLVGYGAVEAFTLNDSSINWSGAYGGTGNTSTSDKLIVVESNGTFNEYFFFTKPAGWPAGYDALDHKWIKSDYTLATATIPAGRGFWYQRRGTGSFTFQPNGN